MALDADALNNNNKKYTKLNNVNFIVLIKVIHNKIFTASTTIK